MTTHIEKIQALGNRMVTNLNSMGVSASFSDGGLTLADKILEINSFGDGLFLAASDKIAQSSDTVYFTAVYLDDGETVSGKDVFFLGLLTSTPTSRTISTTETKISSRYDITNLPTDNTTVYLDKDHRVRIQFLTGTGGSMYVLTIGNAQGVPALYYSPSGNFSVDDGKITFTNESNVSQTVDISSYDCSVIKTDSAAVTIDDYGVFDTTDNYGVATATYTCTGAGAKNIIAMSDVSSNVFTLFDAPVWDGDNVPTSIDMSSTTNAVLTDEVVTLKAEVSNTNDNPCINVPIEFKQGNTVLGTARTDVNGLATLTHTWTDSDIFDVSASYGNVSDDLTMFVKDKIDLLVIYGAENNIIQTNDYLYLWAFLTDVNGNRLVNEEVSFYKVKDGVETQIGSAVSTDSNGIASLDYVGGGVGQIGIRAKYGSVQSNTYEVMDYINFDNGIDGDCSNIWTGNTEDLTRQSDGSLFSSTSARRLLSSALISGDFEATFEAIGTNSPLFGVEDANTNRTRYYIYNDNWYYYKISRVNGVFTAKASSNGTTWVNLSANSSNVTSADCYFMLQNQSGTKSIKFKNVKIYPI